MINLYQQRDFGEKINATFNYATKEFRTLGLSLLYIAGPVTLVAGIAGGFYQSNMLKTIGLVNGSGFGGIKTSPFAMFEQIFSPAYWLLILFSLLSYVLVSLTVYSHVKLYGRNPVDPITVGAVWQDVQASLLGGVGITLVTGAAIIAGLVLFILPGIYMSVPLSLGLTVYAFEGTGISEVFSRCFKLIKDKWWSTLGLVIVMSFIAGIMGLIFSLPASIVTFMGIAGNNGDNSLTIIITQTIAILGTRLLSALVPLALSFQYFNLVERQEGVGLLSAIDSIGTAPHQPRSQDEGTY